MNTAHRRTAATIAGTAGVCYLTGLAIGLALAWAAGSAISHEHRYRLRAGWAA